MGVFKGFGLLGTCITNVVTNSATLVKNTTATFNGQITTSDCQIIEKGFYYSTSNPPYPSGTKVVTGGAGIGSFTYNATGLTVNTTYYVTAYAKTDYGTYFGNTVSFLTEGTAFFQFDITLVGSGLVNTFNVYKGGVLFDSITTTGSTYNGSKVIRMYFSPSNGQQIKFERTGYNTTSGLELGLGFDKRCCNTSTSIVLCDTWVNNTSKFTGTTNFAKWFVSSCSTPPLNCTTC
jgi:hypothetical protein